jgi:hypothetical protein
MQRYRAAISFSSGPKLRWLGRKSGIVRTMMGRMKEVAPADRREYGQGVNRLKQTGKLANLAVPA